MYSYLGLIIPHFRGNKAGYFTYQNQLAVFTNTFQILPDIRSGTVMNFTRPNKILQDQKN